MQDDLLALPVHNYHIALIAIFKVFYAGNLEAPHKHTGGYVHNM